MRKITVFHRFVLGLLCVTLLLGSIGCTQETNSENNAEGNIPSPTVTPTAEPIAVDADIDSVIISQVYGAGNATDAPIGCSYIQLFNTADHAVSLAGVSLYVSTDGGEYKEYAFPTDTVINGRHYYLIRGAAVADYPLGNAVLRIDSCDLAWNELKLDTKENRILLAASGKTWDKTVEPSQLSDTVTYFVGTESTGVQLHEIHTAQDMSKNKIAVKVSNLIDGYYDVCNLTKVSSADLENYRPQTSQGDVNTYTASRLEEVRFSHAAGLYQEAISLTLKADFPYVIFYTTDGSTPTVNSTRYSGPIQIKDTSAMSWGASIQRGIRYFGDGAQPTKDTMLGGVVIKAIATDGFHTTQVFTNTYFVIPDFDLTYHVKVFSLSMPERSLISAEGFYNRYSVSDPRPRSNAYLEVFNEEGERFCHTNIEVAVSGKYSASKLMKSLRLYFKGKLNAENEGQSSLVYDLFDGYARDASGAVITEFERLLLRNAGNDCGLSYIRDSFSQRLGGLLGVDEMAYTPALVFINGEFWGMYNCRERYETQYISEHYGVAEENVTVMESDYSVVNRNNLADYVVSDGNAADGKNFNDLYHYIRDNDPAKNSVYTKICEQLDIDSVINMYVEHLFLGAADWPHNNIKLWRNSNPNDPSGTDTKWHFALLDQDTTLALCRNYTVTGFSEAFNYDSVCALIVSQLMRNTDFKNRFFLRYYEAVTEIYTVERLTEMFYEVYDSVKPLMTLQAIRWPGDGASVGTWEDQMNDILTYLQNRPAYALNNLYSYFNIDEAYILKLQAKEASAK